MRTIKHAYHETGTLQGELKGKTLLFTRRSLDDFAARSKRRGRPFREPAAE